MRFLDCNAAIGLPQNAPACGRFGGGAGADEMLAAMDRAGIERSLVWHVAQRDQDAVTGNRLLADAIAGRERLIGCWSLLPSQSPELPPADGWFAEASAAGVKAMRAFPKEHRYLLRPEVVADVMERMLAARMPLILSLAAVTWDQVSDLLAAFPELTVILADMGCWGPDRYFRPLIERYPNTYIDISDYLLDGGIESFVGDYGPGRMLFGSGFPTRYHGGMMLALAHAEIPEQARRAVAAGNLERLLSEVKA
ncbi:hypothetical protein LCGC14_1568820 [marine sediment metagenome]|uniref:Amidohydrolase-related domain-containing protein n=1 Tax=marine sediment metagenome TaxID=412755 RepID=A0A0F9L1H2_9ZZZZ